MGLRSNIKKEINYNGGICDINEISYFKKNAKTFSSEFILFLLKLSYSIDDNFKFRDNEIINEIYLHKLNNIIDYSLHDFLNKNNRPVTNQGISIEVINELVNSLINILFNLGCRPSNSSDLRLQTVKLKRC